MKKLLLFLPFILLGYNYPINYKFNFIHKCMQNSSIKNNYKYCKCVFNKIKKTFPYNYFIYHSSDKQVLEKIAIFSKECLKK